MPLSVCHARAEIKWSYRKTQRGGKRRYVRYCISFLEFLISIYSNKNDRNFCFPQSSHFFCLRQESILIPTNMSIVQVLDPRCFCSECINCCTPNSTMNESACRKDWPGYVHSIIAATFLYVLLFCPSH